MAKLVTKKFDEFFDMLSTNTLSRDKLNNQFGVYQDIHYGDVLIKYPFCLDCEANDIPYINDGESFNKTELKDGDVVFADTAEDDTVGKCVEILNVGERKIVSGLHTYLCRPKFKMASGYLGYFLNSDAFHNQLLRYIAGSKVSSVNKTSIKNTYIFYPDSIDEQCRIVSILSSADRAIASSEALIEKYRHIKQGLLTDLLTPKEGWKKMKLGEYVDLKGGFAFQSKDFVDEGVPLIRIGDIQANGLCEMYSAKLPVYYINDYKDFTLNKDDTLIAMSGATTGKCTIVTVDDIPALFNQRVGRFVIKRVNELDNYFLYYTVSSYKYQNKLLIDAVGGAQPNVSARQIESVECFFPKFDEQKRIASILSNIDAKIAAEQAVVEKYKGVKKGLMDKLFVD